MNTRALFLGFTFLATAAGCGDGTNTNDRTIVAEVASFRIPCVGGETQSMCLMVRDPGARDYQIQYMSIQGFEPGGGTSTRSSTP